MNNSEVNKKVIFECAMELLYNNKVNTQTIAFRLLELIKALDKSNME